MVTKDEMDEIGDSLEHSHRKIPQTSFYREHKMQNPKRFTGATLKIQGPVQPNATVTVTAIQGVQYKMKLPKFHSALIASRLLLMRYPVLWYV
jgi:hypothetical protein